MVKLGWAVFVCERESSKTLLLYTVKLFLILLLHYTFYIKVFFFLILIV